VVFASTLGLEQYQKSRQLQVEKGREQAHPVGGVSRVVKEQADGLQWWHWSLEAWFVHWRCHRPRRRWTLRWSLSKYVPAVSRKL